MSRLSPALIAIALAALNGCGGAKDSTAPPPGPTVITLSAARGSAQETTPGTALPVNIAVMAKNAGGQPVAGLTITFAIDSGGGTLAAATAITAADGTASPGAWTLGALEGANVITAAATGATALRISATAVFPTVTLVNAVAVPAAGGKVSVELPGNVLNGLSITVPGNAYITGTQLSIASKQGARATLPAGYAQVGPAIVITNAQAMATVPMLLTIPVSVQSPDTALAAFFLDPTTGRLELIPAIARTATTLSVFTRHFTADRLMKVALPGSPAGKVAQQGNIAARTAGYSPIQIVVTSVPAAQLNAATATGFTPGRDDWEFVNLGTGVETEGICAGMTISAMYYFYAFRAGGTLNGKFNSVAANVPMRNFTNAIGLRLATVMQTDTDWASANLWFRIVSGYAELTTVPSARLHYQNLVMAMQVTKLPQLLELKGATFIHAVVAFASANGQIQFADPNAPGLSRLATFASDAFVPFDFNPTAAAVREPVISVRTLGASSVLDASVLAAGFAQVADSSIGKTRFPQLLTERFDTTLTDAWVALDSTQERLITSAAPFKLRTRCLVLPVCSNEVHVDGPGGQVTTLIDTTGNVLAEDSFTGESGAIVALAAGTTKVGVLQRLVNTGTQPGNWSNFRWIKVNYEPVKLTPTPVAAKVDSVVTFSVQAGALVPLAAKFTWTFDDGTPAVTTTVPNTTHIFALAGAHTTSVKMFDAANALTGKASASITVAGVNGLYSVWALDTFTVVPTGAVLTPDPTDAMGVRARQTYDRLLSLWRTPVGGAVNPTLWYFTTATSTNNLAGVQPRGVYFSDSLPGSAVGGRDPVLDRLALPSDTLTGHADDPIFNPRWLQTGTPPDAGRIVAQGALEPTFSCIGVFISAHYVHAVDFVMTGARGSGTITYTFRDVVRSCSGPNAEIARWTLVINFKARRIK